MTRILLHASCLLVPAAAHAQQVQHALDFDGLGDQALVFNASQHTAGASSFSITCWVRPRNANADFPDMEGFAGFRDDATCDFYLLQTYGPTLEGRFRNSTNTVFTLTVEDILQMDTWQHLALVYTGTELRMFHNGVLIASTEAWGTNVNPSRTFHIGNLPFASFNFWLDGRVDEVTLWRRGLTAQEVGCIKDFGSDPADPDLRLYFRMDQGEAGADNSGIGELINATGGQPAIFSGLGLSGNSSNFMAGAPLAGTTVATLCPGETFDLGGQPIASAGTYTAMVPHPSGCDSLVVLQLSVAEVDNGVVQNGSELASTNAQGPWQWVDCNAGFAPIPGATGPSFTAEQAGSYAVAVQQNGCTSLSACFEVTTLGLGSARPAGLWWRHDMAAGLLHVRLPEGAPVDEAQLFDATGRAVRQWGRWAPGERTVTVGDLPAGLYFVRLSMGPRAEVLRVVLP